jgi:hypothetical protein
LTTLPLERFRLLLQLVQQTHIATPRTADNQLRKRK